MAFDEALRIEHTRRRNAIACKACNKVIRSSYLSVGCEKHERVFFLKLLNKDNSIIKVGQYPAWKISGDKTIEKMLGDYRAYLHRGLICESQGYGIGAFAYYRRITEKIIDELIGDMRDLIPESDHAQFDLAYENAKKTRQTSGKIALVKDFLPATLEIEGMNPLAIIYSSLSEGLHADSDERCLEYAGVVRESLVYLVSQVSESRNSKRTYANKIRSLQAKD